MSTGDTDPRGGVAHRGTDLTECGTWETTGAELRSAVARAFASESKHRA